MAIKFEINMTNKWLYSLVAVGVLLALGVGVYAYQSNMRVGNPPVMGHSAGEIHVDVGGTLMNLNQALFLYKSDWFWVKAERYNSNPDKNYYQTVDLSDIPNKYPSDWELFYRHPDKPNTIIMIKGNDESLVSYGYDETANCGALVSYSYDGTSDIGTFTIRPEYTLITPLYSYSLIQKSQYSDSNNYAYTQGEYKLVAEFR